METEKFASLLRSFRKESRLTQAELADLAALHQSTISQFEADKKPSKSSILQIADALKLDAAQRDQLFLAAGYAPESELDLYSPTLRSIAAVLQDPTLRELLRPLCAKLLLDFSQSWQSFARGKQAQYVRDWGKSVDLCQEADTRLAASVAVLRAYILDTMGTAELHLGNLPKAEQLYNQVAGLVSPRDFPDPYIRALVYTHQGDLRRSQSMWPEALKKYELALQEFKKNANDTDRARVQRKIALLYLHMGQWSKAASYLEESLRFFQRLIERPTTHTLAPYELAKTYMVLGLMHSLKGEWDLCLDVRQRALDIARDFQIPGQNEPDTYLLMQGYLYYGYDSVMVGELQRAENHLSEALSISTSLDDQKEHGLILLGLAKFYVAKAEETKDPAHWKEAQKHFALARDEHEKRGDDFRYAITLNHWATLYLRQNDTETALNLLLDAQQRFCELNNHYYLGEVTVQLCETHYHLRNYGQAQDMAGEAIDDMRSQEYPFFKHLSLLWALKARVALTQDRLEDALHGYAQALMDAVRFNYYHCQRVAGEINRDLENAVAKQGRQTVFAFYQDLARRFQEEVQVEQQRGVVFTEEQSKSIQSIEYWLTQSAPEVDPQAVPMSIPTLD